MVEPVETAMFNAFDQAHAPQWKALRAHFYADNEKVKAATRELIDTSFRKLRSAEGAFELLQVISASGHVHLHRPCVALQLHTWQRVVTLFLLSGKETWHM